MNYVFFTTMAEKYDLRICVYVPRFIAFLDSYARLLYFTLDFCDRVQSIQSILCYHNLKYLPRLLAIYLQTWHALTFNTLFDSNWTLEYLFYSHYWTFIVSVEKFVGNLTSSSRNIRYIIFQSWDWIGQLFYVQFDVLDKIDW